MILLEMYKGKLLQRPNKGFALIELLVSIVIIMLLFGVSIPLYSRIQLSAQLNESTSQIIQTIKTARTRAVSRLNDSAHGVYFQSSGYTLYQGSSYSSRDSSYDLVVDLENAITLSEDFGGNEINFSKGLGLPNETGSITINHGVEGSKTITIDSVGSIQ